jgi:hypothetical protein
MLACAGVENSGDDCGTNQSVGTIYCYEWVQDPEGKWHLSLCLTHPYQMTVAPPIKQCVFDLPQGTQNCDENMTLIYPETYTYECMDCHAVTTDPVQGDPCWSAQAWGAVCPE